MIKRALVCGASQGIGAATAIEMAKQGWQVTVASRSQEKLEKLCATLPGDGHDFLAFDIGQPDQWEPMIQANHGKSPYSALVLNSGGPKGGPISQAAPEEFIQAMQNHLVANSVLTRIVMEQMKKQNWGRILTVTSTSVKVPIPHLGVSNTVRAAVASWGKTLSLELAPFGVTVNNVMPGFTQTPRLESLIRANADKLGKSFAEVESAWKDKVPMRRFAKPEETAGLIAFLMSEGADYITGQNIAVDGGRLGCL